MKKQLRKIALAVIFSMVAAVFAPASQVAYAATKTFTYAEQNSGDKVSTLFMDKGEKVDLKFNGVSNWKTYKYKWQSSNSKVAVVDSAGIITAIGNGIATITLKISGGDGTQYTSAGVVVYVGQKQQVSIGTAATEEIKSYTVEMGKSVILKANGIKDAVGDRYTFNWSSTDTSVAKVSSNGVITTVKPGLTVIQLSVTKKFSGEVMQATPIAVLVTASGAATPVPTKAPTATPAPTKAPGATATPTPTVAPNATATPTPIPTNGVYTLAVTSDRTITLTFANKVTYTQNDVEFSQVIKAGTEDILIKQGVESVKLDSTGKILTIKTQYPLTTDRYNVKVGTNDKGTTFPVTLGEPNRMEVTYTCLGREGVAYAYDSKVGIDVPVTLSYKLYYNNIDVTESYANGGYVSYEMVSPTYSDSIVMAGEQMYFYASKIAAVVKGSYTYYNASGKEIPLTDTVSIAVQELGNYNVTHVANWTIIKNDSTTAIDWNNPVKSVVAGTSGYKIVALLADSFGYFYSTDERGVDRENNIYSVNDTDTLYAMRGYNYAFSPSNDKNFYVDATGNLYTYAAEPKAATYITLSTPNDIYSGERRLGAWQFTVLEASKLSSVQIDETNVTLMTQAKNNEDLFCKAAITVKVADQYGNAWEGTPNLEVTSSVAALNSVISQVATVTQGTNKGEWKLNIDAKNIKYYTQNTNAPISFIVTETTTKRSDTITVYLKNPADVSGNISISGWNIGMRSNKVSYGNGELSDIGSVQAEIDIYQISRNGGYKVGLLTNGMLDENNNTVTIKRQDIVSPVFTSTNCSKGDIYVLVLGPDMQIVKASTGANDLGLYIDPYTGKVSVNVTAYNNTTVTGLAEGTYTVRVTRINGFNGTYAAKNTYSTTFVVEDNTKDVTFAGYKTNGRTSRTVTSAYDDVFKDIVLEVFNFKLGGVAWTNIDRNMITSIECTGSNGVYRIASIEFAVPADEYNYVKYKKTVTVNQTVYTGVNH